MFEKLKKYLNDYSKEINEQPKQEYDKNIFDLWVRNAALAGKTLGDLNARYLSLDKIDDVNKDIPAERRKSYKLRVNYVRNSMALVIPGYSLDALKSILSKDYNPPEKTEDLLQHLLTLHHFYVLMQEIPTGLPDVIFLRTGYALSALVSSAVTKIYKTDYNGAVGGRTGKSTQAKQPKKDAMGELVFAVFDDLNKQKEKVSRRMITEKINTAFVELYYKRDLKSNPRYKGLIENGHKNLIKKLFNEWSTKNKETGIPQVSTDTVRRRLKDNS